MGVYVFSRRIFDFIPEGRSFGFDELMHLLLSEKESVRAFRYGGYWLDIGQPADLERAKNEIEKIRSFLR
jgi:NDP-sugar pyrophosphorylase family protein